MDTKPTPPKGGQNAVNLIELETLNFKVPSSFKRAYKGYAALEGISMLELLKEGFELSKSKRRAGK